MAITKSYDFHGVARVVISPVGQLFRGIATRTIYLIDSDGEELPIHVYTEVAAADIPVRVDEDEEEEDAA